MRNDLGRRERGKEPQEQEKVTKRKNSKKEKQKYPVLINMLSKIIQTNTGLQNKMRSSTLDLDPVHEHNRTKKNSVIKISFL